VAGIGFAFLSYQREVGGKFMNSVSTTEKKLGLLAHLFSMELCICSGWSDWIFSAWSAAGVHQAQQECQKGIFPKDVTAN
jgi:hypothetical protein